MTQYQTQALTHIAAANLTQAVMQRVNAQIPVDTRLSAQEILSLNLMAAEVHKVFYDWLARSYTDSTWRTTPAVDLQATLGDILAGRGAIGAIVKPLLERFLGQLNSAANAAASNPLRLP